MQLGPELLPLVHLNAFPEGPGSALNAPSGQLLREAASPGTWGCLDSNLAAAVEQAAAWAAGRLEALFVRPRLSRRAQWQSGLWATGPEVMMMSRERLRSGVHRRLRGHLLRPASLPSRRQEGTGLTQARGRRRSEDETLRRGWF